jgi:cell surface protein SprA
VPVKGDTTLVAARLPSDTVLTRLWVLKNNLQYTNPATDSTWNLMWRNVYIIPDGANVDNFEFKMFRKVSSADSSEINSLGKRYADVIGVAENGKPLTTRSGLNADGKKAIFDFQNRYFVIPLYTTADSLASRPFTNPALGSAAGSSGLSNICTEIYTKSPNDDWWNKTEPKYVMYMTGSSRDPVMQLGWGVSNERVLLNGVTPLVENLDYIIDRESGRLELISDKAKLAKTIEVEYQQENMFVFEKRAFLGAHAKVDLPFIGRNSYLGASVLYQNESARDKIPRIGQVPFNKFLLGANTLIDFEPEWMTGAVNLLPFITTAAPSSAKLSLEVAHSRQTPSAGSNAYIDDFEASNEVFSPGLNQAIWKLASPPSDFYNRDTKKWDGLLVNPPAWNWYWFTPDNREMYKRDSIWKILNDVNTAGDDRVPTLRLVCRPVPQDTLFDAQGLPLKNRYVNPWAGIMTYFPGSLSDRDQDRYLEVWMKIPAKLERGRVHFDFGDISEDLALNGGPPNGAMNYESVDINKTDTSLDRGLDTLADEDEFYVVPDTEAMAWDTLDSSNLGQFVSDPSRDNWARYDDDEKYRNNKAMVNGTENDLYLTTEDINRNGWSDKEKIFRATIDMSVFNTYGNNPPPEECPYFDPNSNAAAPDTQGNVWRRFRIPLRENKEASPHFDTITPSASDSVKWSDIKFMRIWIDSMGNAAEGFPDSVTIEFAAIDFVGNQWQPRPTGDTIKMDAGVLNTEDNLSVYNTSTMPPALLWEAFDDDTKKTLKKEQCLQLVYRNLERGEEAVVERFFLYQNINLSLYDEISMFVKPLADTGITSEVNSNTWFVFRFGLDSSTYYEYRERFGIQGGGSLRGRGWYEGIKIDLQDVARLKGTLADRFDSVNVSDTTATDGIISIKSRTSIAPSFSEVKWMALGVMRDSSNAFDAAELDSGELWIDAMRVSGIKGLYGWAMRGDLTTQWADFMNLSVNAKYEDADFRQMSENYQNSRDSRLASGISAQWTLDKFLPSELNFSIPLTTSMTGELSRPKIQPGSDIFLTGNDGEADGLREMYRDYGEMVFGSRSGDTVTEAERWEQTSVTRSIGISYSKGASSENPLVALTAERLTANASYGRDSTAGHKGRSLSAGGADNLEISSNHSYKGRLGYDLSPRKPPKWTSWAPFREVKGKNFPRQMKQYELTYLPSTLNFKLADGGYSRSYGYNYKTPQLVQIDKKLGIEHGFQVKMRPIKPILDLDFDFGIVRNFDNDIDSWKRSWKSFTWEKILAFDPGWNEYLVSYGEKKRTQRAGLRLSPQFFDWLTHTVDYSSEYGHYPQNRMGGDSTDYLNTSVQSSLNFRSGFRMRTLADDMAEITGKYEGASQVFKIMEKGLSKLNLNDINFTYSASLDIKNEYLDTAFLKSKDISAWQYFLYQLSAKDRSFGDVWTGNIDDNSAFGGVYYRRNNARHESLGLNDNDTRATKQTLSVSTNLRLPQPIDLSLNGLSLAWKRNYTHKNNNMLSDTAITWPEIHAGASTRVLDRINALKQYMQSMDLSSGYTFMRESTITYDRVDITRTHTWSPLISFKGTLKKWPVSTVYTFDFSQKTSRKDSRNSIETVVPENPSGEKSTKEKMFGNNLTLSYKLRPHKKSEIQFLRWTIPLKGELEMGIDGKYSHGIVEPASEEDPDDILDMSLSPHMSYFFTENVKGELSYAAGRHTDKKQSEVTVTHVFSVMVRINF